MFRNTTQAAIIDIMPHWVDTWAICTAPPDLQHVDCFSDDPFGVSIPLVNGLIPDGHIGFGVFGPKWVVTTPEPSTGGLLVAVCFLCAFVALRRRMA